MSKKKNKKVYCFKDRERFILSNDKNGSVRIFLEVDYHSEKASINSMCFTDSKTFVFQKSQPELMEVMGNLIAEAGRIAAKKLKEHKGYE